MKDNKASLFSRARLTEGELENLYASQGLVSLRRVADEATARALRVVVDWLRDEDVSEMMGYPEVIDVRALLVEELEQAGIPHLVEVKP